MTTRKKRPARAKATTKTSKLEDGGLNTSLPYYAEVVK